ncbi:extracellular solute-binding protein family 1 [Catenulispora acidiphila DSM 44928]|uniref:Extracellular solute-binding protein family 1 n=1 Tax=Catenulispora acidiphila (strain DSM 44928 / JCM 14897 / NBRC 102108 / NRRL B-24433 / ID139908) TaxID=479433 RepID=C7QDV7_CATAD|nr:extracellular solute-binding protein [Catenulispora acidiphila]ACU76545.1 extracellular solute-binding protein family 1 [Catenulispora acidiphila DSM 44928]
MRRKLIALSSAAVAVALMASACSSSKSSGSDAAGSGGTTAAPSSNQLGTGGTGSTGSAITTDGKGKTVNIWLMQDAQKGWQNVVDQANQRFTAETGAQVKINWQTWTNYGQTVDAAIGSSSAPDAIELGNTQTAKYIGADQLVDLTGDKSKFDNSGAWLDSLAASGASPDGSKQYAIPYYAGSRVLIYRKDLWAAAGVTTAPTTLDELKADLDKVKAANTSTANFSALYLPGQNWYTAISFGAGSYGVNGVIAKSNGSSWTGTMTDPKFLTGISTWDSLQKSYSVGGATKDETDQDALMAKGNISAIIGNGWEAAQVYDPKVGDPTLKDKLAEIAVPGVTADAPTPAFLGGSNLAVPSKAANSKLGEEWIRIFTDTASMKLLAAKAIPNNKTQIADYIAADPANQATGDAAKGVTWFIPNSPNWAPADETQLKTAFGQIASGQDPATVLKGLQDSILKDLNS